MKPQPGRLRRTEVHRFSSFVALGAVGVAAGVAFVYGDQVSRGIALLALLAGAVLACSLAWRQSRHAERQRAAAELGQVLQHAEQLSVERRRQQAVVKTLAAQQAGLRSRAVRAELRATRLQQELSTARGNNEALRVELELQAALSAARPVSQWDELPDAWVTARELWRISDGADLKRSA